MLFESPIHRSRDRDLYRVNSRTNDHSSLLNNECHLQGIAFFLPNSTWLQPPGYVHQMITQSWQPSALNFSATSGGAVVASPQTLFSAQKSADGEKLVMRLPAYANTCNMTPGGSGGASELLPPTSTVGTEKFW